MNRVVIGLGSNVRPREHIPRARAAITAAHRLVRESRFVTTAPVGDPAQPDFINGALCIETDWDRGRLKAWLRRVEADLGRPGDGDRSGPRTIDLDILVWNGEIVDRDVHVRDFLRTAVREVWPELFVTNGSASAAAAGPHAAKRR